jgi:hypothetical protein
MSQEKSETAQLIALLQKQIELQQAQMAKMEEKQQEQQRQHDEQKEHLKEQITTQQEQMQKMFDMLADRKPDVQVIKQEGGQESIIMPSSAAIPPFVTFDPSTELWTDYLSRFNTFVEANAVPEKRRAQVFLTNQSSTIYKQLVNLAAQQATPKDVNKLTLEEIIEFMKEQYDPKLYLVRERYKFWSNMGRKPGETLQELAARIRQDAATCDFSSITDPQDEALRQRFICSVNNEAVLKACFKKKDGELNFADAVKLAIEIEDAAKVAKETVYGAKAMPVNKIKHHKKSSHHHQKNNKDNNDIKCFKCGKAHKATECPYKEAKCHFCDKIGHLEAVCRKKQYQQLKNPHKKTVKRITKAELVKAILGEVPEDTPKLDVQISIQDRMFKMELDTATTGNFVSQSVWKQLGKPKLDDVRHRYESASKHDLPIMGTFTGLTKDPRTGQESSLSYIVTKIPDLNLLGRNAIQTLGISVDNVLGLKNIERRHQSEGAGTHPVTSSAYVKLQQDCHKLCDTIPELFEEELGCLQDFELEVQFKTDAKPVFHKDWPVPFALCDDLAKGYEEGIAKGIRQPVDSRNTVLQPYLFARHKVQVQ